MERPHEVQEKLFHQLISAGKFTKWGKKYDYQSIKTQHQFAERIPIQDYETLKPYINRMMHGEKNVLWNGRTKWFSKSSGTTSDKSKFIPISHENLKSCHIRGTWDTMTIMYHNKPDARQFELKSLLMGGNLTPFEPYPKTLFGDVSAIMINRMPWVARPFFTPDMETALMPDFEEKIEKMAMLLSDEKDLVMIGGVPTWTVVLIRRILELKKADNLLEIWPNLEAYIHGGVSFTPFRDQFEQFYPSDDIIYKEIYNASEGYFAIQFEKDDDDLLLLLDNGIYYEFIPMMEWDKEDKKAIPLSEVIPGVNYAMIISNNAGLWRYMPGDTVMFTSTNPYKIQITGRTKQFVNAFGEEVMVSNTDKAIARTCKEMEAVVLEYMVAPIYFKGNEKGGHEWIIEFEKEPNNLDGFIKLLDENLQQINSDYEAKRYNNMALEQLTMRKVPRHTFVNWLRSKGKFGGQNKVPRLANHRDHVDDLIAYLER